MLQAVQWGCYDAGMPNMNSQSEDRAQDGLRERKRRDTLQRIAQTGLDLFIAKGYEATTLDDVAAAAGISRRTFFHYFTSKDEILLAWQVGLVDALYDAVLQAATDQSPLEALCGALQKLASHFDAEKAIDIARVLRSSEQLRAANHAKFMNLENAAFEALCRLCRSAAVADSFEWWRWRASARFAPQSMNGLMKVGKSRSPSGLKRRSRICARRCSDLVPKSSALRCRELHSQQGPPALRDGHISSPSGLTSRDRKRTSLLAFRPISLDDALVQRCDFRAVAGTHSHENLPDVRLYCFHADVERRCDLHIGGRSSKPQAKNSSSESSGTCRARFVVNASSK